MTAQDPQHPARAREHPIEVAACVDADRETWDRFIAAQPGGSLYHRFAWRAINREALGAEPFYLAARAAGQIAGVLPLNLVSSRMFGRILCSMPYVNFGGPCAISPPAGKALVDAAILLSRQLGADYMELRCREPVAPDLPVSLRKLSMTIALDRDPDVLWKKFTSKHRTNIRRAEKNGIVVRSGGAELLPDFYSIMELSWRSLGTPLYRRSYFERIMTALPQETRIFVAYVGSEAVAAAFNGYFNGTVEGMWAGGGPRARELQVNYVLYWEMIRDGCMRGLTHYHLGRSTADSGAEDFKKKWNAEAQQLYWYFHRPAGADMPDLNVDNPKFRAAIAAWKRLPLWMTRLIGPLIARSIP